MNSLNTIVIGQRSILLTPRLNLEKLVRFIDIK